LGLYTHPFEPSPPDFSAQQEDDGLFDGPESDLNELVPALHVTQFHLLTEAAYMRLDRWTADSLRDGLVAEIEEEIMLRLDGWRLAQSRRLSGDLRRDAVQVIAQEWAAKIICCLKIEVEVHAMESIEDAWQAGRLPWQCMNGKTKTST
ncbi:uncharacterized protein LAESUDRAFT_667890, partial [Laetiporus sulphureus 93-53]